MAYVLLVNSTFEISLSINFVCIIYISQIVYIFQINNFISHLVYDWLFGILKIKPIMIMIGISEFTVECSRDLRLYVGPGKNHVLRNDD